MKNGSYLARATSGLDNLAASSNNLDLLASRDTSWKEVHNKHERILIKRFNNRSGSDRTGIDRLLSGIDIIWKQSGRKPLKVGMNEPVLNGKTGQ